RVVEKQSLSFNETSKTFDEIVDVLFTLTSFETFDALAGPSHSLEEVAPVVQRLVRAAIAN
ncbi:MAG TPA: TetR/AcrR family transcriptional regulator, partial [Ktedonobacteraceae bacterium]